LDAAAPCADCIIEAVPIRLSWVLPHIPTALHFCSGSKTSLDISGRGNVVADALSRFESVTAPPSDDVLAAFQDRDNELWTLLRSTTTPWLKKLSIPVTMVSIYCDTRAGRSWPYVPSPLQLQVFQFLHDLSHPGTKQRRSWSQSVFCGQEWKRIAAHGHGLAGPASTP
jgi:hypothetical protein